MEINTFRSTDKNVLLALRNPVTYVFDLSSQNTELALMTNTVPFGSKKNPILSHQLKQTW